MLKSVVTTCVATADDIASNVLSPGFRTALREGWNYLRNHMYSIATYLQIVGLEQRQQESE